MWYRLHMTYGPGHMASYEEYVWYGSTPSESDKKEWFNEVANQQYMDWPIGGVDEVPELPEKERQEQIRNLRGRIFNARSMLKVLGVDEEGVPLKPPSAEPWVQCTTVSNECLGGCRSQREHDAYQRFLAGKPKEET